MPQFTHSDCPILGILPIELSQHLLTFCDPEDIISFSLCCHRTFQLVHNSEDGFLWREVFLQTFDDPRNSLRALQTPTGHPMTRSPDWKSLMLRRMKAKRVSSNITARTEAEVREMYETIIDIIRDATPSNMPDDWPHRHSQLRKLQTHAPQTSASLHWIERILRNRIVRDSPSTQGQDHTSMLSAHVRSCVALSLDNRKDKTSTARLRARRTKSRCQVYDLQYYTEENNWGPYRPNKNIDWTQVEAIINVVLMNLHELPRVGVWADTKPPVGLEATRAYSCPGKCTQRDWAGVEGLWRRFVCFMDYRDLFVFNYAEDPANVRDPDFFSQTSFREATRLIELELRLVSPPEEGGQFHFRPSSVFKAVTDRRYRPLYFSGVSRGVSGSPAIVQGMVTMDITGTPRWHFCTFFSAYDGSTQWSSEGVQVGAVASAFGVVGVWTTSDHEPRDPVGPFWMWKVDETSAPGLFDFTNAPNPQ